MSRHLPTEEESLRILRSVRTRRAPGNPPTAARRLSPLIKALEARFPDSETGVVKLRARWADIVGETLGRLCEPVRIVTAKSGRTLEIRAPGAYAPLIQHQSSTIIDRVNLHLGQGRIEKLRLVQGQVTAPAPKSSGPIRHRPLSAQEELSLREDVSHVDNENVRKALLSLGRMVLRAAK